MIQSSNLLHVYVHVHVHVGVRFKFWRQNQACASDIEKLLCSNRCDGPSSSGCVAREKLTRSLEVHFGFKAFKQGQLQAVLPVAHGNDVFVRMPTGGGKSLCMFLLPLSVNRTAMGVIVSPLISLVEQQVR